MSRAASFIKWEAARTLLRIAAPSPARAARPRRLDRVKKRISILLVAVLAVLLAPVSPVATAAAAACANPKFVTSDSNGMWNTRGYIVHNNMWNVSDYKVSETLSACSHRKWSVRAIADNSSGDGAVKTYPNVHKDFHNWSTGAEPRLSSFRKIRSTFAARTPRVGIYNAAYDIWLNGVPGEHEVMIWTDNHRQVPAGTRIAKVSLSGHTWRVYATEDNHYIAFVPTQRLTHGALRLKSMLSWLTRKGRLSSDVTLGQIGFGFEIVSTAGKPATFDVTDFSLMTRRR